MFTFYAILGCELKGGFMNKVDELTGKLRELLASGAFPAGARFPSEYELQERYSVSRATANKAMALLSAEGLLERGRRGSGTFVKNTFRFPKGWIAAIEDFSHPYNMGMIAGATQEAFAQGYMLSVFRPGISGSGDIIKSLRSSDCLGVLGVAYRMGALPPDFEKPVIYLDCGIEPQPGRLTHSVMCDNYGAALEMMGKVLAAGKKEVVMLGIESSINRKLRMQGFVDGMKKFNVENAETRKFVMHHGSRHEVKLALQKILRLYPGVDFIVTDSDDIVFRIMQVWDSENFAWRNRIGISGFGDVRGVADLHNIPSVNQHPWHIGVEAVKALLDIVKNGEPEESVQIEVPAEVVNAEYI